MSYEILFVASFFATRVLLPIAITLVLGGWLAHRMEHRETAES